MKITLIILQSLDGYISKGPDDDLSWGSKEDKQFFRQKTREIGCMIMGSTTFESMPPQAFSDRYSLVLTSQPEKYENYKNSFGKVEFFKGSADDVVKHLESEGVKHAALIGGANVNAQFLNADLVSEMYITIAPVVLGSGVKAWEVENLNKGFELRNVENMGSNEIIINLNKQ